MKVLIRKSYYIISIVLVVPISILLLLSSLNGRGYGVEKNNVKSELISEIYDESGIAGSKLVSILDKTAKKQWIRHLAERPGADEIIGKFTGNIGRCPSFRRICRSQYFAGYHAIASFLNSGGALKPPVLLARTSISTGISL